MFSPATPEHCIPRMAMPTTQRKWQLQLVAQCHITIAALCSLCIPWPLPVSLPGRGRERGGGLSCSPLSHSLSCCSLPLPRGIFRGLGTLVQCGGPGRCSPFPRRSGKRGGALSTCDAKVHFRVTDPQFGGPIRSGDNFHPRASK